MQNVAQAYRQTQADTIGQGEIVVMLYDGALRFLAQAREKIEARDYAAKGVLISRTLDIINELDSSLNMDVGGELTQNLHQLYFLCTTRLLQANLKLDIEKLDSVATILSGLRDAFAQVVPTPEAKAACAQISAKQASKQGSTVARPVMSSGNMVAPRSAVAGLYNQQSPDQARVHPASAPPASITTNPVSAAPGGVTARPAATAPAMAALAYAKPVPAVQVSPAAPKAAVVLSPPASPPAEIPHAHTTLPAAAANAPAGAPASPSGFAGKRLALYGKVQQGR